MEGLNILNILFIVFLVLKLTNNIDWSWWWVTASLWIPVGIAVVVIFIAVFVKVINELF